MKKLLNSDDYQDFVEATILIPEYKHYQYYFEIVKEHRNWNPDIFQRLRNAIKAQFKPSGIAETFCIPLESTIPKSKTYLGPIKRDKYGNLRPEKIIIEKSFFDKQLQIIDSFEKRLTHRLTVLINYFKAEAGYEERLTLEYVKENGLGKNLEMELYGMMNQSKLYKPIRKKEIESVLPYLIDFPEALDIANERLKQLS